MRSNQKNNRSRGRNNNNRNKNTNPLTRSYDSNGPDVRVRGNASTVAEKYIQLARDAQAAGDSVAAENYLQHAEHYNRIISAAQAAQLVQQQAQQAQQAARAEQQGNRQDNRQENRQDSQNSAIVEKTDEPVAEQSGDSQRNDTQASNDAEQKPSRNRRPRRKPLPEKATGLTGDSTKSAASSEPAKVASSDPANAPQPGVSDLPAFVTADSDSSAAE